MIENQMPIASHGGVRWWYISLTMLCLTIIGSAEAATLPKGDCLDPKSFTDLRHCRFKGADLRNVDLQGADMRGILFFRTQLQGANLTNALIDGRYITYAFLDGVIGLPTEALKIINTSYLVTPKDRDDYSISALPSDYKGGNENIAGLDNIFLTQNVAGTYSTLALLAYPKYGDTQKSTIFARFDNEKFDFPACYRSVNLLSSVRHYYPRWNSMKVKSTSNSGYLIGVHASGQDGDDMGMGGWDMIAFIKLSLNCDISVLHKENAKWAEDPEQTSCQGGHLDYRLVDERTAEIQITEHTCGLSEKSKAKVSYKKIKLDIHN
ncbi:pentapeptide repeat-containing protein [Sideroxyarcus sp. TK5]